MEIKREREAKEIAGRRYISDFGFRIADLKKQKPDVRDQRSEVRKKLITYNV